MRRTWIIAIYTNEQRWKPLFLWSISGSINNTTASNSYPSHTVVRRGWWSIFERHAPLLKGQSLLSLYNINFVRKFLRKTYWVIKSSHFNLSNTILLPSFLALTDGRFPTIWKKGSNSNRSIQDNFGRVMNCRRSRRPGENNRKVFLANLFFPDIWIMYLRTSVTSISLLFPIPCIIKYFI